ncbi:succinate dehydrogenase, hydrophobic membrane anchor protein [Stakelama sediminis]|uniref:Succinate dehydrogenase hydrophobic membrane anchor subunit n=1 Tax=Stakelama sediminis TaxID=463200 RepID=A0A840YXG2_9SPHN|nr:succinate dehydrogenase, hydrophobic membrane anchor protein [Stakelama sediminis]MBB5718255.1 succinate dehydrogenase / fumarate reductase membrane anchor subunit [Stakelama sediminis]
MGNGTSIGRVRALGSAHEGTHHWWHQRLTAAANLFLMTWFLISIARLPGYDWTTVSGWMQSAWVAIPMILLIASVFYHARLGLQVLIEDYAHSENRYVLMILLNAFVIVGAAIGIFSVLSIAFTGASA